jgi:hypothetical protein
LAELPSLGEHKKRSELLTNVLLEGYVPHSSPHHVMRASFKTQKKLDNIFAHQIKSNWEKTTPKEDMQLK